MIIEKRDDVRHRERRAVGPRERIEDRPHDVDVFGVVDDDSVAARDVAPPSQATFCTRKPRACSQKNGVVCSRSCAALASRHAVARASTFIASTSLPSGYVSGWRLLV